MSINAKSIITGVLVSVISLTIYHGVVKPKLNLEG